MTQRDIDIETRIKAASVTLRIAAPEIVFLVAARLEPDICDSYVDEKRNKDRLLHPAPQFLMRAIRPGAAKQTPKQQQTDWPIPVINQPFPHTIKVAEIGAAA